MLVVFRGLTLHIFCRLLNSYFRSLIHETLLTVSWRRECRCRSSLGFREILVRKCFRRGTRTEPVHGRAHWHAFGDKPHVFAFETNDT